MDYKKIAEEILNDVGGKENIAQVTHCMTRLRLTLNNKELFNKAIIESIKEVKGSILSGTQHQIILGSETVEKVHGEFIKLLGLDKYESDNSKSKSEVKSEKMNPLKNFIKVLSDIFIPIIPVLVASGFLMGIVGLFIYPGYFYPDKALVEVYPQFSGIATMINMFANTVFTFLPVVIGFSATKRFGGNPYVGAVLGLIMVNPQLINPTAVGVEIPTWNMFGYEIKQLGYQSTVLPILAASFLLANIDNWLKAKLPKIFKILSAGIAILIVGIITFLFIGPVLRSVGYYLSDGLVWLYSNTGVFGGAIFGLLYSPFVITGMHHAFIPIEVQLVSNIATTGGTFILPMAAMNNVALGGASLAIWYLTKDKDLKAEASIAGITAIMGISEPALFGIILKFKHAFISALIGSSVGSAIMSFFKIRARGMGAGGVMGYLLYDPKNLLIYTIGMIVSIVIAFTLTVAYEKMILNKKAA